MTSVPGSCQNSSDERADNSAHDRQRAEQSLEPLKLCAEQISIIGRKLEARFSDGQKLPNGIDAVKVQNVIARVRSISNREYRNLVGLLNYVREENSGITLERVLGGIIDSDLASQEFREICFLLKSIRDQGFEYHSGRSPLFSDTSAGLEFANPAFNWDREFADRTLRLVRILYPLGINMLNPGLHPGIDSGIAVSHVVKIALPGSRDRALIEVLPFGDSSRIVHAARDSSKKEFEAIELPDGKAVLIGRELSMQDLYGRALGKDPIEVPVAAKVSGRQVSRGGLLVIRKEGIIYLFDRGSLHDVAFSFRNNQWNRYQSATRKVPSGYEHGKSMVCEKEFE